MITATCGSKRFYIFITTKIYERLGLLICSEIIPLLAVILEVSLIFAKVYSGSVIPPCCWHQNVENLKVCARLDEPNECRCFRS